MLRFYFRCLLLICCLLLLTACIDDLVQDELPLNEVISLPNKPAVKKIIPPKVQTPTEVIQPPPTAEKPSYHEVVAGDTLYSIGLNCGEGYQRLALWNHIAPPYRVVLGQKIRLSEPPQEVLQNKSVYQKPALIAENQTSSKDKKSSISIDNGNMLKLNFKWPLRGVVVKTFSEQTNKGIDIEGLEGQPVRASAAGKVVHSGLGLIGFGQLLIIKHNDEYLSAYSNNGQLLVSEGQDVEQGQAIAEIGNTGIKRTVLHFEIRKNGKAINPLELLPNTYQ